MVNGEWWMENHNVSRLSVKIGGDGQKPIINSYLSG